MNLNGADPINKGASWVAFAKWAQVNRPEFYNAVIKAGSRNSLNGLGAGETTAPAAAVPWWEKLATAAVNVYATVKGEKRQDKVLAVQLEQAKAGQTPINANDFATAIRLQHEIDLSNAANQISNSISPQTKTALMIGGGILGAIILLPMLMGGNSAPSRAPARRRK